MRQDLEVVVEVGACICRRGPVLGILKDELADLRNKCNVAIRVF
jgi:hypothetical protein